MAINIEQLQDAAGRFDNYTEAIKRARKSPQKALMEKIAVAERHREVFVPAAERLMKTQTVASFLPPTETVPAGPPEPSPFDTVSPDRLPPDPLVLVGGLVPEVIQRDNDLRPIRFLQIGLLAARAVGKIRIIDSPSTEEGEATGFMVAPGALITNWHVLKNRDYASAASIIFDDEDGIDGNPLQANAFRLRPDLLFYNDELLDYAIVGVSPRTSTGAPLAQYGYLPLYRQTGKLDPTQREAANIIQHPGGGSKKIALRDNYVLEVVPDTVDPKKKEVSLFYGTDTLKGSSGSPVCSDQWYVVALHRGGVPETKLVNGKRIVIRRDGTPATAGDSRASIRYITNEGTRISRIYNSLEKAAPKSRDAALAFEKLSSVAQNPLNGPISLRTSPIILPGIPPGEEGGPEEIIRRTKAKFEGAKGYKPTFLGTNFRVPLPNMTSEVKQELAPLKDSTATELKYANYSLRINRERRTPIFAAGNIDGSKLWRTQGNGALPPRPKWSFDPRMDEDFQPDDLIFSNAMQRGHLFKREDAVWGTDAAAMKLADEHSFTIPNATPMIANFNNVEWGDLEDIVSDESGLGHKISYFAGPIFRSTDRFFSELRSVAVPGNELHTGMRVPESFWKIVFWAEGGKLKAAGFVLRQTDEIAAHGPI
ncbi:MAG: DNA/RNA non-specific endonuclease, partial [Pyrinomonadaceae bacterium]